MFLRDLSFELGQLAWDQVLNKAPVILQQQQKDSILISAQNYLSIFFAADNNKDQQLLHYIINHLISESQQIQSFEQSFYLLMIFLQKTIVHAK